MTDNDLAAVRWVVLGIVVSVVAALGGCYFGNRVAIEKGLCQGTLPGQSGYYWVPCESSNQGVK